ncbi:MAG: RDD family protein [Phycisphaeraceae bacterium]
MIRLHPWLGLLLLLLAPGVGEASPRVIAAGDGRHVWMAQELVDDPRTLLAHHGAGDADDELGEVRLLPRPVAGQGLAASGDRLYVAYQDGTLQIFRARRVGVEQHWAYASQPGPGLPRGAALRSLAAGQGGLWALVSVDDAEALAQLDADPGGAEGGGALSHERMMRNLRLGLPPNMPLPSPADGEAGSDESDTDTDNGTDTTTRDDNEAAEARPPRRRPTPAVETATQLDALNDALGTVRRRPTSAAEPAVDRLVHVQGGRWRSVPLPDDWPTGRPARLLGAPAATVRLVVRPGGDAAAGLRVYQWDEAGEQWSSETYDVPAAARWAVAAVDGHVMVGWQSSAREPLRVETAVLRHGRVQPVGALELAGRYGTWALAGTQGRLWLVGQHTNLMHDAVEGDFAPPWRWTSIDLQGQAGPSPEALAWRSPEALGRAADYFIMVGVLVSAVLLMLLFWRRDAAANQLALPATLRLAELGRRFAAAGVDLLPAAGLVMALYGLSPAELLMRWPGGGVAVSWQAIEPGVLVIGLFVAYTTLSELLTQRTLGKALLGMRVSDLAGGRPRVWQLLVRNGLKSFDLVAWPLLILLVLGPYRQRLGDLVARTVVITRVEPEDADEDESKKDE